MKMYYKKRNCLVEVGAIFENGTAKVFLPDVMNWTTVKLSKLVPEEYWDKENKNYISKTERNKIKEKLTLSHAVWTCSDGVSFQDIEQAINYERSLKN